MTYRLLWVLGLIATSCTTMPPLVDETQDSMNPPTIELGGANDDGTGFIPWHGTDAHPRIIRGPQGGQHVWISLRAQNLAEKSMVVRVVMRDVATGELVLPGEVTRTLNFRPSADSAVFEGMTAFVNQPCVVTGREIEIVVTATDVNQVTGRDSAVVTAHWELPCAQ